MILFFAALITATGSLPVLVLGTYAVQLSATYGLGNTELGLFISVFFGMGAFASFLAGRWARSEDWPRVTMLAGVLSLFVVVSLSWTIFGDSKWVLAFLMIVGGLSFALAAPTATRAIMSAVPQGRGGLWFGVKQAGVPMAAVMCGGSLWLVADSLGWRIGATSCGALIVLNFIVVQVLVRGNDASVLGALRLRGKTTLLYPNADLDPDPSITRPRDAQRIRSTLHPRQQASLLMTAIAVLCACVLVSASQAFFVVSAQSKGLSLGTAGALLAIGSLVGVALRIAFGMWTDHKGLRELRVVALLLLFGVLGAVLLALPGIAAVYFGGALMFSFGWGWQGLFHLGLVRALPRDPTMATGIGMTGAALGMTIGAPIFGVVSNEWGFSLAWLVTGMFATLGVIAFFVSDLLLHSRTTQVNPLQRGTVLR